MRFRVSSEASSRLCLHRPLIVSRSGACESTETSPTSRGAWAVIVPLGTDTFVVDTARSFLKRSQCMRRRLNSVQPTPSGTHGRTSDQSSHQPAARTSPRTPAPQANPNSQLTVEATPGRLAATFATTGGDPAPPHVGSQNSGTKHRQEPAPEAGSGPCNQTTPTGGLC
jgi:hypothetical protein